jgi:hypothetical protein
MSVVCVGFAQPSAAAVVFSTDFNSGAPPQFSGVTTTVPVQGYSTVPDFSGLFLYNASSGNPATKTTLTLTGLPAHTFVGLDFLFAPIDSWDGNTQPFGGAPDFFNVAVNGVTIFSRTFDNFTRSDQSYTGTPLTYGSDRFSAGGSAWPDAAYDMGADPIFQSIPHTSSTLVVDWWASGAGWSGGTDESWAIENLSVSANVIPEPGSYAMLIAGLGLIGFVARRRQRLSA